MFYQSTRDSALTATGTQAILQGIAPDGGLYVPAGGGLPRLNVGALCAMETQEMAAAIMGALLPEFSEAEMKQLVRNAYAGRFETEALTPTVPVGSDYILELFRGPTSAFKDVALCMLPQLITASRAHQNVTDEIVILTATSGDTGKAALEGFRDVPGTRILVFYPEEGVSRIQKAQMTTQQGSNVTVCAIRGNFDDAQTGVKTVFRAMTEDGLQVMSINLLLDDETSPVLWRGPILAGAVKQFWTDVVWGDVDYLFVDMPPGTGDVPLTVFQSLPIDGVIIVTSPQDLVSMIVSKAVNMANMMKVPILGFVENYSYLECPDCGRRISVFGPSHLDEVAEKYQLPVLARLPIDPGLARLVDAGKVEDADVSRVSEILKVL